MGPWALASWARFRVWVGGRLATPWPPPLLLLLPWPPPLVPWWRGKATPSPLYKGGLRRRSMHNISTSLRALLSSSWCTAHLHLSPISLSRGLLKGCVGARQHHRCMPSCCGFPNSIQSHLLPQSRLDRRFLGHHDHRTCVSTRRCWTCGVGVVAPSFSTTLRSATSASSTSLVRER
jgi:hypothetical protein